MFKVKTTLADNMADIIPLGFGWVSDGFRLGFGWVSAGFRLGVRRMSAGFPPLRWVLDGFRMGFGWVSARGSPGILFRPAISKNHAFYAIFVFCLFFSACVLLHTLLMSSEPVPHGSCVCLCGPVLHMIGSRFKKTRICSPNQQESDGLQGT